MVDSINTSSSSRSTLTTINSRASETSAQSAPSSQSPREPLVESHGSLIHTYPKSEVPWPFCYNREMLELYLLDHNLVGSTKFSCSFIDFKANPPKRVLDLGTGLGTWCIEAAKGWPDCTFVGFDLINVQINLNYMDPSIASRITWVHGNFLKEGLPFSDQEFDYVHIHAIAFSVPEDKWHSLFDEIHRVLKLGGHVEQLEEDAVFPVLPRWFTAPLHEHANATRTREPTSDAPVRDLLPESFTELPHDHALLEFLFNRVFESRFINPTPCSILPNYFAATFSHVVSPPILNIPMPPLAPLPPSPGYVTSQQPDLERCGLSVPTRSCTSCMSQPLPTSETRAKLKAEESLQGSQIKRQLSQQSTDSTRSSGSSGKSVSSSSLLPSLAAEETTRMGGDAALELFAMDVYLSFDEHNIFLQLHRMAGLVYGAKEAMWQELQEMLDCRDPELLRYGWEEGKYQDNIGREKFEAFWERYKADIHARMALWHPMTQYGWNYPRQESLTKTEIAEEEWLRQAILEGRSQAKEEEIQPPVRSIRLLVGMKDN